MSSDANNSPTSHSANYGQCGSDRARRFAHWRFAHRRFSHRRFAHRFRRAHISLQLRLRLYASFVIPVLTYNMGTWGLTQADLDRIDTYHRRHLRQIIGVHWPNRISNVDLYHRCQCRPISESIVTARWRLFGHVLRLPRDAPAQRAIDHYFTDTEAAAFRGRPRTSLPTTLCSDLRRIGRTLRQPADIEALRALSREQWRHMERVISA